VKYFNSSINEFEKWRVEIDLGKVSSSTDALKLGLSKVIKQLEGFDRIHKIYKNELQFRSEESIRNIYGEALRNEVISSKSALVCVNKEMMNEDDDVVEKLIVPNMIEFQYEYFLLKNKDGNSKVGGNEKVEGSDDDKDKIAENKGSEIDRKDAQDKGFKEVEQEAKEESKNKVEDNQKDLLKPIDITSIKTDIKTDKPDETGFEPKRKHQDNAINEETTNDKSAYEKNKDKDLKDKIDDKARKTSQDEKNKKDTKSGDNTKKAPVIAIDLDNSDENLIMILKNFKVAGHWSITEETVALINSHFDVKKFTKTIPGKFNITAPESKNPKKERKISTDPDKKEQFAKDPQKETKESDTNKNVQVLETKKEEQEKTKANDTKSNKDQKKKEKPKEKPIPVDPIEKEQAWITIVFLYVLMARYQYLHSYWSLIQKKAMLWLADRNINYKEHANRCAGLFK